MVSIHHKFKFYLQEHSECPYRGFHNFPRGHTPDPLWWGMGTFPDSIPLTASWLDLGASRLGSKLSVSRTSILNPTGKVREKSGNFIWRGEWSPWLVLTAWETSGAWCSQSAEVIEDLGRRIRAITDDSLETIYFFERLSVSSQRGNAVAFSNTFQEFTFFYHCSLSCSIIISSLIKISSLQASCW